MSNIEFQNPPWRSEWHTKYMIFFMHTLGLTKHFPKYFLGEKYIGYVKP